MGKMNEFVAELAELKHCGGAGRDIRNAGGGAGFEGGRL